MSLAACDGAARGRDWGDAQGGSERQLEDVRELIALAGASLDRAYIESWVDDLGVRALWDAVS